MNDSLRWALAVVIAVLIIGLIGHGRGTAHHRGIDVGVRDWAIPTLGG